MLKVCKALLIAFTAISYVAIGVIIGLLVSEVSELAEMVILPVTILMILVGLACIVCTIVFIASRKHMEKRGELLKLAMASKFLLTPFSSVNILVGLVILFAGIFAWVIPPVGPLLAISIAPFVTFVLFGSFALEVLCLAVPSLYFITSLVWVCRQGIISKAKLVIFIILMVIPVVDVVSCPYIYAHVRKGSRKRWLIIPSVVYALAFIAICLYVVTIGLAIVEGFGQTSLEHVSQSNIVSIAPIQGLKSLICLRL